MAADAVVASELKSLQEELSAARKDRSAAPSAPPSAAEPAKESAEEREIRDQLQELAREVTSYFEQAEKTIAAHPAESVVSALLLGILIGRLLGRR